MWDWGKFLNMPCGVPLKLFINGLVLHSSDEYWCVVDKCPPPATPTPDMQYDAKRVLIYTNSSPLYGSHHSFPQWPELRPAHQGESGSHNGCGWDLEVEGREQFHNQPNQPGTLPPLRPLCPFLLFSKRKLAPQALHPVSIKLKRHSNQWQWGHSISF